MGIKKKLTTYRIIGSILILFGIIGYLTVGDDLRHLGEFLSVSCLFISGTIFLLIDFNIIIFKNIALQWVSICLLACIPFGGIILDNMPAGICMGFILGIALAIKMRKSNKTISGHSPFEK